MKISMHGKINVVCVHFGKNEFELKRKIVKMFGVKEADVYVVDTSRADLFGDHINNYFEFSGYKKGTEIFVESVKNRNSKDLEVIYINDTIFDSHLTILYKKYFSFYLARVNKTYGLYGIAESRNHGPIISSCFFIIYAPLSWLSKISFHPASYSCKEKNVQRLFVGEKEKFDEEINNWLYPSNFIKGWYKTSPFIKIDNKTYNRKRLAIYLEYTLPTRVRKIGLEMNGEYGFIVRFIKLLDRCYCNVNKMKYRLSLLIDVIVNKKAGNQ